MEKTGYSRRILTKAVQSFHNRGLIAIIGNNGQSLECSRSRRGAWLYFNYQHMHFPTQRSALLGREEVHWSAHNKTNKTKLNKTKGKIDLKRPDRYKHIGEILNNSSYFQFENPPKAKKI